jgi:hypothetical protein
MVFGTLFSRRVFRFTLVFLRSDPYHAMEIRQGHKLTPDILNFAVQLRAIDPSLRSVPLDMSTEFVPSHQALSLEPPPAMEAFSRRYSRYVLPSRDCGPACDDVLHVLHVGNVEARIEDLTRDPHCHREPDLISRVRPRSAQPPFPSSMRQYRPDRRLQLPET